MGNVYMEADQVRFKDSTYRNVQEGLEAALQGGGGGGTTVVANPEGSATADLSKLQVGTTIYGIPETAAKVTYDNTSSGLTADDVQEAIDEVAGDIGDIQDVIPSGATSSNKLATASDIPDAVTGNPEGSATAGNLTKLQIGSDIYNIPSGTGNVQYVEVSQVHLDTATWTPTGGGIYSSPGANNALTDILPSGAKLLGVALYQFGGMTTNTLLQFVQGEGSPRSVYILSPVNTFAQGGTYVSLRISYTTT